MAMVIICLAPTRSSAMAMFSQAFGWYQDYCLLRDFRDDLQHNLARFTSFNNQACLAAAANGCDREQASELIKECLKLEYNGQMKRLKNDVFVKFKAWSIALGISLVPLVRSLLKLYLIIPMKKRWQLRKIEQQYRADVRQHSIVENLMIAACKKGDLDSGPASLIADFAVGDLSVYASRRSNCVKNQKAIRETLRHERASAQEKKEARLAEVKSSIWPGGYFYQRVIWSEIPMICLRAGFGYHMYSIFYAAADEKAAQVVRNNNQRVPFLPTV